MVDPHHLQALTALGVSNPHKETEHLTEDAVTGVIRWAKDENRRGRPAGGGLITYKLRNGGLTGYGESSEPSRRWWQTFGGRQAWLERNVGDLNPLHAETAIIGLTQQNREPSVDLVREWTELVERQEREYDAACRALVAAQRKAALSGRAIEEGHTVSEPSGAVVKPSSVGARPESAKKEREHSLPLGSPND